MSQTKRKHHFIPRFYLTGFTPTGESDDFLNVFDIEKRERRRARSNTVAYIRDFYRIDQETVDPDVIENAFAQIEGQACQIIAKLTSVPITPLETNEFYDLMYFIALLCVRIPSVRSEQERFMINLSKRLMKMSVHTRERWNSCVREMDGEDAVLPTEQEYQQMKDFVLGEQYELSVGRNFLVGNVIEMTGILLPMLLKRKWWLLIAEEGSNFVTSDRPVVVSWEDDKPRNWSPGFGTKKSIVTVPLNRRVSLLGRFEGENNLLHVNDQIVAMMNLTTAMNADRYVFAADEDFRIGDKTGKIGNGAELLFNRRRNEETENAEE